jgi:nitrite reductase/ring-hydroxylating ferredoxin subunit
MLVKCEGPNCKREFDAPEGHICYFCSIECACYAGKFNVRTGWKNLSDSSPVIEKAEK